PWPRAVHATLLDRLAHSHPRAVLLDLVLSEPDPDPRQDRLLARAMAEGAPVVLPVAWQALGGSELSAFEPVEPLRSAVRLGAAEASVDADGVLRHAFLSAGPAAAPYPNLALALLHAGGEQVAPGLAVRRADPDPQAGWRRDGRFLIRYVGPTGSFQRVSYVDVLRGAVPPERFDGRYVLIGMTAQGLGDTLATPMNGRYQAMPGIEAMANILTTLRSGDSIRQLSDARLAAGSAALVVLLVFALRAARPRLALPLALLSLPLAVGASLLALRWGLWASPVPYVLAAVPAYPLWSWRRLERTVVGLDLEIARVGADPLLAAEALAPHEAAAVDPIDARLRTLRRAGALVREVHRFVAESLAAMPAALLVTDADARVVLANAKAARLFEVESADELAGLDLPRLLAEFTTPNPLDWARACAELDTRSDGLAVEGRLGGAGEFVVQLAALDLHGLRRLIVTVADVGPVKQAEREREEALAFVSHDLRSPAQSMLLLAELNQAGRLQTPREDLLVEVRQLAARLLTMSEDFVRTAQVRTRPLARERVALRELAVDALGDLHGQAVAGGVPLRVEVEPEDGVAEVDRALVARAITNLVSNAIKHSRPGDAVELRLRARATGLTVAVRDRGPGLAPDQIAQLGRGNAGAPVRDARGVGLGLLFVQRVAARHGGRLDVAAAPSGGALFELSLPPQGIPEFLPRETPSAL
ncbi:MAG: CHASE2 domain-containing protein, partial [Burkholderiales bacterium]|nr:CHASE2 domain-containing protein [Burkholderiales bacterium]